MEEDKTALNKDERIAARRAKLAARKNKDAASPGQAADTSAVNARQFPSKAAVAESRAKLNRAKISALKNVEEVSQDHDESVSKWRRAETERRDTRHSQIEAELAEGARANQSIRDQWEKLSQYTIAQDLYAAIEAQQQACRVLIARKDALVKSLTSEIAERDEAYELMLKRHAADISELVQRMQSQVSRLLDCYQKELAAIEDVYVDERRALIEGNKEELRALFERRREMELKTMEARLKREEEFQAELDKIRSRDSEDYNNLKITLENNIQLLEQQLEEMRATYQLNIEKLDYNHRVLKEMDAENKQTVKHHKQKLKRLKEALNAHAARYAKQEAAFKQENHELTEEYKRVTEQFKDLQRKCTHFHAVDQHKFKEIWEMNEAEVKAAIARLIDADHIIQEQVLGMPYTPPPVPQYDRPFTAPAENKSASPRSPLNRKASVISKRQSVAGISLATVLASATSGVSFPSRAQSRASRAGTQGGGLSPAPVSPRRASKRLSFGGVTTPEVPNGSKYSNAQIRHVMELLAEEAGFLVEQKFRERMSELTAQEQVAYSAEAIVHALGVEDVEDLEQLVGMFFQSPAATECHVDPNDVVRVVREFMLRRISNATGGVAAAHGPADSKAATMPNVSVNVGMGLSEALIANEKKQRRRQHEKEHWQSLGLVIGRPRRDVWRALKLGLEKYHELLTGRVSLIAETTALSRQNAELKALLQQYMGAKLNEELQIPPTRIVRL